MSQAASSIVYATPYVHGKGPPFYQNRWTNSYSCCLDLDSIRDYLVSCLGSDFAHSAVRNQYHQVSSRILRSTSTQIPSAFMLDSFLQDIANAYGIDWSPEPRRQEMYLPSFIHGIASLQLAVSIHSQNY
jgi:Regulator of Vps4 activity in the MVB pathway